VLKRLVLQWSAALSKKPLREIAPMKDIDPEGARTIGHPLVSLLLILQHMEKSAVSNQYLRFFSVTNDFETVAVSCKVALSNHPERRDSRNHPREPDCLDQANQDEIARNAVR
jgi:hypothetical protein